MKWYLYILYSEKTDKYYVGISSDPDNRLKSHNELGDEWTAKGRPWKLMFVRQFSNRSEAHKLELWIKRQKSKRIIELIINGQFEWDR